MLNDLEETFGCAGQIDELERRFDDYCRKKSWTNKGPRHLLQEIKIFLHAERPFRENLFRNSRLPNSDCLTLSILGSCLARRKGVNATVAVPRGLSRAFHAAIVYESSGAQNVFIIAGRGTYKNPREISPREASVRLKITSPLLKLGKRAKRLMRR